MPSLAFLCLWLKHRKDPGSRPLRSTPVPGPQALLAFSWAPVIPRWY